MRLYNLHKSKPEAGASDFACFLVINPEELPKSFGSASLGISQCLICDRDHDFLALTVER
jgi:hypothetical protein